MVDGLNMDIYKFLESPQIAEHCRKLGQTWNPFEMAIIIGHSERSIFQKHIAWRELMTNYPDVPTFETKDYPRYESFHSRLLEFINYEEKIISSLEIPEDFAAHDDSDGNIIARQVNIKKRCSNGKRTTIPVFLKPNGTLHDLCEDEVYDAADIKTAKMFRGGIYIYIPFSVLAWQRNRPLSEDERLLFYRVMFIVDKWDPLDLWVYGCPVDEYECHAWDIFEILTGNGCTNELDEYFNERYLDEDCTENNEVFLEECEKIKKQLLELI
jgi:hypothetical protein